MAKFTSSQGNFTWAISGAPNSGVERGKVEFSSNITEVKTNFDWMIDNLESCWAEKVTRCATRYDTVRTTAYGERHSTANDTQYDVQHTTKYSSNNSTYCSSVNSSYTSSVNSSRYGVYYDSAYVVDNSVVDSTVYSSRCAPHYGDFRACDTNYSSYTVTVDTNVRTTLYSSNCSTAQTSDHTGRNGSNYTGNNATDHNSVNSNLDCQVG